ncbi:hypothetical protein JOM56_001058 [Amanita muscaria]
MKPSVLFGALHDSYADDPEHRCHPGTRQYLLKRLQGWIDDVTSTERISWLHGTAGSGKSAITHTIADSNGKDKVAATFFFCRSDPERNNGNRLFITLAWQLALSIPFLKSHIIQSLNSEPGLPWKSVETQFKELITQPFQATMHNTASQSQLPALVVIIDGIDECSDENLQRRILRVLENAASNVHVPLRFLITSRLETPHIKRAFDQFNYPSFSSGISLNFEDDTHADISKYLKAELSRIAARQGLAITWPGQHVIQDLAHRSSDHFIYASTIVKLFGSALCSAETLLNLIRDLQPRTETPFAHLDAFIFRF